MTTLIGGLGQIIASVRYCEQGYTTASGLQKLQFMKNFWEQEALRPVTLQPNQRVKGFIFFPRNVFKTNQFEIVLTLANSAHIFPFSLPAR